MIYIFIHCNLCSNYSNVIPKANGVNCLEQLKPKAVTLPNALFPILLHTECW